LVLITTNICTGLET